MATSRTRRGSSRRRTVDSVGKPRGVLHPRVQQVGPEHFGIVCFDCAKVRSKFLLADFYGRLLNVRVAHRFCRIAFQMVAGRQVFHHPCIQGRHYILEKLTAFHTAHDTPTTDLMRDLKAVIEQIPSREHAAEAKPLQEELQKIQDGRRRGPQLLGDILPIVLARLGVGAVQSPESGE